MLLTSFTFKNNEGNLKEKKHTENFYKKEKFTNKPKVENDLLRSPWCHCKQNVKT